MNKREREREGGDPNMITCIKCNQEEAGASWNGYCSRCVNNALLAPHREQELVNQIQELELANDTHEQALQTSQTWHERQKAEIIAQWKTKLQTFINQRKTQLQQEIELIKEVLHE